MSDLHTIAGREASVPIRVGDATHQLRPLTLRDQMAFEQWVRETTMKIIVASLDDVTEERRADIAIKLMRVGWYDEPCIKATATVSGQTYLLWLATRDSHGMDAVAFSRVLTDDQRRAGEKLLAELTWGKQTPGKSQGVPHAGSRRRRWLGFWSAPILRIRWPKCWT